MNFSAISSSFLGHSSLFTELLLMFWYLPVSLNVKTMKPVTTPTIGLPFCTGSCSFSFLLNVYNFKTIHECFFEG